MNKLLIISLLSLSACNLPDGQDRPIHVYSPVYGNLNCSKSITTTSIVALINCTGFWVNGIVNIYNPMDIKESFSE